MPGEAPTPGAWDFGDQAMSVTAIENACDFGALPAGACQLSFNFANSCERTFPSSQRRGGRDINKMLRSILIYGADGVVRPAKVNIAPNSPLLRLRATALALRARLRGQKVASRLLD